MKELNKRNHKNIKIILICIMVFSVVMIGVFGYLYYLDIKNRPLIDYPSYSLSTNDWTSGNVVITVSDTDKISEYSFDGGNNYQSSNTYEVLTNGTFNIVVKDINGRVSKMVPVVIRNIDKDAPIIIFEESTTIQVGSRFSLRNAVSYSDGDGSGVSSQYVVVPDSIDTNVPGTYDFTYTLFDKVGNYTEKHRKITVVEVVGTTYYRSRSISYENYKCEPYMCNCVVSESAKLNSSCPTGYSFIEPDKCCQLCYKTCRRAVYGEWSEWTTKKIKPTSSLEVETKTE